MSILSLAPTFLGVVATIVAVIYVYFKLVIFNYWKKKNVVYAEPTVPFGNIATAMLGKENPGEVFGDLYNQYKKHRFFGIYNLFVPNLMISDPELVKFVLTKEFQHFHDRNMFNNEEVDPLSGHLFLMKGQKWKNLRIKLSPTFTSGKMKMMFNVVKSCGDELKIYLNQRIGTDIDIRESFARYTTDSIMSTAFGVKSNSLQNPDCEFRYWGKKAFESRPFKNTLFMFAPKVLDTLRLPYYEKDLTEFFVNVFQETFNHRLSENRTVKRDFLDLLMQLINDGYVEDDEGNVPKIEDSADGKLTLLESVAQAFVFFLAGFETSSSTSTFCIYELARNQEIQDKVRDEAKSVITKYGGLTYEALNDMPYLHKVISETLRKYPIVTFLSRMCTKEIVLPGTNLLIEKGTDVIISLLGIQRDPDYYPDPDKFDPERFNEENVAARHNYTYLPFGEGPRICIGMRFGLMQTKIAVINSILENRITLSPKTIEPIGIDPGSVVYVPKHSLYVQLAKL